MSLEGKEEKVICEFILCPGIGKSLKRDNCEKCEHFGGVQEKPIIDFMSKKSLELKNLFYVNTRILFKFILFVIWRIKNVFCNYNTWAN